MHLIFDCLLGLVFPPKELHLLSCALGDEKLGDTDVAKNWSTALIVLVTGVIISISFLGCHCELLLFLLELGLFILNPGLGL